MTMVIGQGYSRRQIGGAMSKRYGRPSPHYRYEHYDPFPA